jgi:hypothetical protein
MSPGARDECVGREVFWEWTSAAKAEPFQNGFRFELRGDAGGAVEACSIEYADCTQIRVAAVAWV